MSSFQWPPKGVGGTVTSVSVTAPGIFSVSGSPITSSGTIALTLATETANTVFAGPTTGSAATPTFRALVAADIPNLSSIQPTAATGANVVGANASISAGNGTGTGGSGAIIFQTAPVAASSSTANVYATVGQVDSTGAWTHGATSTTPTHVLNTANATGSSTGTLLNVPGASLGGNPAGYITITINGVTSYLPYWQ